MNRFYGLAIALLIFAGALAAILLTDVAQTRDKVTIELALKALATAATVGSVVATAIARKKQQQEQAATPAPLSVHLQDGLVQGYTGERMGERQSLVQYVDQMRASLDLQQAQFVPLTTVADTIISRRINPHLLPALEWVKRQEGKDFTRAESTPIELGQVPDFERVILLGEPGSGKSTCLRELMGRALDSLESWLAAHLEDAGIEWDDCPGVPIYVPLSEWRDPTVHAEAFLRRYVEASQLPAVNNIVVDFGRMLVDGRFLFILDGLNELPRRRAHRSEGRHERSESKDSPDVLRPPILAAIDAREGSLRDLANHKAARCKFVLSCRSHEYVDSFQWQVVRILSMDLNQIDQFVDCYLGSDAGANLKRAMRVNPTLGEIGTNPFFLASIIEIYRGRPGVPLESRGQIMVMLCEVLFDRERERRLSLEKGSAISTGTPSLPDPDILVSVGRIAFRMVDQRRVGSQAALGDIPGGQWPSVKALVDTGLLLERDGEYFFFHQIVQEFLAARALRAKAVRRKPATLLADSRWSEVVALWYDLDPEHLYPRTVRALRARNLPWRRPRSFPSVPLMWYQLFTNSMTLLAAFVYVCDFILPAATALPFLFGLGNLTPIVVVAVLLAVRLPWSVTICHRGVIPNAAYVLRIGQRPSAVPNIISAFSKLWERERLSVATQLAEFGPMVIPHLLEGLRHRRWRVRAGCVSALGEVSFRHPEESTAVEALLAMARVDDPKLTRALARAYVLCPDSRTQFAVTELIRRAGTQHPATANYRLLPLGEGVATAGKSWTDPDASRLDALAKQGNIAQRQIALRLLGLLRRPSAVDQLRAVADDRAELMAVRKAAVGGLGFAQTAEAVAALLELADPALTDDIATAIRAARDPMVLGPLVASGVTDPRWQIRQAAATTLGKIGAPEGVPALALLVADRDDDVRMATARALGSIGSSEAVELLVTLAEDGHRKVRRTALVSLIRNYPDLAPDRLLSLAKRADYPDRVWVISLLSEVRVGGVEQGLTDLAWDVDRGVRLAAEQALRRARFLRESGLRPSRPSLLHPFALMRSVLRDKLHMAELRDMWNEELEAGTPGAQVTNKLQARIAQDPELTYRFRLARTLLMGGVSVFIGGAIFLGVLLARLALWATSLLASSWMVLGIVVVLAVVSGLTFFRRLEELPYIGVVLMVVRWISRLCAAVLVLGAVIFVWWLVLAVAAVAVVVPLFAGVLRNRRRRFNATAALQQGPMVGSPVDSEEPESPLSS